MQAPEPPQAPPSRPNLLSASRAGADAQQQILARLESKAAQQSRAMGVARNSLRVAGMTLAGIGVAVALLVFIKQRNAAPKPLVAIASAPPVALPAAPRAPLPALMVEATDRLPDSTPAPQAPALTVVEQEALPLAALPVAVVRIAAPATKTRTKVKAKAKMQKAAPRHKVLASMRKPKKLLGLIKVGPPPVDTDVSLLSAILLHSSRPAVVPPAVQRPPCTKSPQPPCAEHAPDP